MKIRCTNCYRVLNHNELYCTRCGTKSLEIVESMKKPMGISSMRQLTLQLGLYLLIGFLINGALSVLFGVLFVRFYPHLSYGDIGESLPQAMTLFAYTNALLITGLALLIIFLLINKEHLKHFWFDFVGKKVIWLVPIAILITIGLVILMKKTTIIIIPSYFDSFLKSNTSDALYQPKLLNIALILISYAIVQEILLCHHLIKAFDEALISDVFIIVFVTVIGALLDILTFSFDWHILIGSLLIHLLMTLSYFYHLKHLSFNLYFRIILILIIILL